MVLWGICVWASVVGVVNGLEVSDNPTVQSFFDNEVSEQHELPASVECGPHREVAVTKAAVFGVPRRESGSHFGTGSGEDVGQIVHHNLVDLGPSRRQVYFILERISFVLVEVLQALRDTQFNICVVNFDIPCVQQESYKLGFVLPQHFFHVDTGGPGGDSPILNM